MQFVLVIYHGSFPLPGTPEGESIEEAERKQVYADFGAIGKMDNVSSGPPLCLPQNGTTVRVENGETVATKGPYIDAKSSAGGFLIVEAEDLDAAIAVAARVPQARMGGAVEVRPAEKYW